MIKIKKRTRDGRSHKKCQGRIHNPQVENEDVIIKVETNQTCSLLRVDRRKQRVAGGHVEGVSQIGHKAEVWQ